MALYQAAARHALDDDGARGAQGMGRDCLWCAFSGIFVAMPTSILTSIVVTMACDQVGPASESVGNGGGFIFIICPMVVGTGVGVLGGILAEVLLSNGPLGAFLGSLGASALATVVSFKQTFGVF